MMRGEPVIVVIRPKAPELKFVTGLPQLKVFNRLNASTRNSNLCVLPTGTSFDSAMSTVQNAGPLTLLRT